MSGLVEFLLARFAEDEAVARMATPGPWEVDHDLYPESVRRRGKDSHISIVSGGRWGGEASIFNAAADAHHIARHDPARVLAECEAKRRIVAERPAIGLPGRMLDYNTLAAVHEEVERQREYAFRLLALPYADHSDFDDAWRIDGSADLRRVAP